MNDKGKKNGVRFVGNFDNAVKTKTVLPFLGFKFCRERLFFFFCFRVLAMLKRKNNKTD